MGDIVIQIKNNYEAEVDMGDMKIENASQNDEPSIDNTFIPNGMLGKIIDIYVGHIFDDFFEF